MLDERVEIPVNVTESPPIEQWIAVAVSNANDSVDASEADLAEQILACLDTHAADHPGDEAVDTQMVASCLPNGFELVPATFIVE